MMELDGAWSPYRRLESILWTLYKSPFNDTINRDALWWHVLSLQHVLSLKFDALPACFVTPARFVTTGWQNVPKGPLTAGFVSQPLTSNTIIRLSIPSMCVCVCVCVCVSRPRPTAFDPSTDNDTPPREKGKEASTAIDRCHSHN